MKDLRHTSLSVQAAQLKRTLESRDKRRQADKQARHLEREHEDGGAGTSRSANQAPSQQVAALTALTDMPDAQPMTMYHCDLCQASFTTEAGHTQHLQSAVHRKALEKKAKEDERIRRMQEAGLHDVTAMALGAGAWSSTHGNSGARQAGGSSSYRRGGGAPGRQQGRHPAQQATAAAPSRDTMSHQELTAALRAEEEPLTIDGWVPPSISVPVLRGADGDDESDSDEQMDEHAAQQVQAQEQPLQQPVVPVAQADDDDSSSESSKSSGKGAGADMLGLGYQGSSSEESDSDSEADSQDQPPRTSFF